MTLSPPFDANSRLESSIELPSTLSSPRIRGEADSIPLQMSRRVAASINIYQRRSNYLSRAPNVSKWIEIWTEEEEGGGWNSFVEKALRIETPCIDRCVSVDIMELQGFSTGEEEGEKATHAMPRAAKFRIGRFVRSGVEEQGSKIERRKRRKFLIRAFPVPNLSAPPVSPSE